ncbi:MAG: hypothetical protein K6D94_05470, partial [Clostridiales bacterium]|nr:hypothetical protein [Clostridiales bacterium]
MPSKILKTILRSGALLLAACSLASSVFAESEKPVYPADITDGTYSVDVKSSSSMFRVVDCKVTVSGDNMTAVMTMSGQGYGYVFMGTGEEALAAPESEYIPFELNADGQKTFTVPLEALDKTVQCAAWSIKKEQWYDRDLVFMSDTLPKDAVKRPSAV